MPRPLRVFLCHASQDKPAVRRLHRYLKQHGIEPWLDEIDLLPGENWEVEIPRALSNSDVILVCLSKNSINKEGYVQKEIVFALDKALEKPEGTIFIIPAKLEDCEVPKRLNRYQWVDLFRPDSNKRLLLGLNKRVASLGSDVLPVILEDTRQRKSHPKPIDISQIDRDTQEKNVAKADLELIEEALREKLERETAEQAEADRVAREAKEKTDRNEAEKIALAKLERETAEQAETERLVREAKEKVEREAAENLAREKKKQDARRKKRQEVIGNIISFLSSNSRAFAIGGLVIIGLIAVLFGGNTLLNNLPATNTLTVTPSVTSKFPTSTATKVLLVATTPTIALTPTLTKTPDLPIGSTMVSEKDGMKLVYVPAGKFSMGSNSNSEEKPIHQVYLNSFWIDQTEVTNSMYEKCVEAGACNVPKDSLGHFGDSVYNKHPVIYVSWEAAKKYCLWAERELPSEAQWEKAARGPYGNIYPWGNDRPNDTILNYNSNVGGTTEVGQYPTGASIYGALDMAGNVWEWVNDWYSETYYENSMSSNPLGPDSGQTRVLRGGSLISIDIIVRSTFRYWNNPLDTYNDYGFRCARSP